jgi:hypothetical protein
MAMDFDYQQIVEKMSSTEKSQDQTFRMQHTNVLTLQVVLQGDQGQAPNNNSVKLHPACTKSKP